MVKRKQQLSVAQILALVVAGIIVFIISFFGVSIFFIGDDVCEEMCVNDLRDCTFAYQRYDSNSIAYVSYNGVEECTDDLEWCLSRC